MSDSEAREKYLRILDEYKFDAILSRYFSTEMCKALTIEEILEVYSFLEVLLNKTAPEEDE